MFNKGLELIEAHHLFPVGLDRLKIVVHPQSVIHSMVEYRDRSTLAQLGPSDMRVPIAIYMLVIGLMCVAAIGAAGLGAPWMIPVGALLFTASDVAVVRDRFVAKGFINRAWGLRFYYAAQLLIAWSIGMVA